MADAIGGNHGSHLHRCSDGCDFAANGTHVGNSLLMMQACPFEYRLGLASHLPPFCLKVLQLIMIKAGLYRHTHKQ